MCLRWLAMFADEAHCRQYFKGPQFDEPVDASGKVAVVTGASSGIGRQVARGLNLRGAKVYMLCRNREKALCAIEQLVEVNGHIS
uniref:Uncharacterized protein n=1 Tax=Parascaris equorum TaxID=6256 RepID=A0A914S4E5_PAREQ